ncbi:SusC/RagA family TonB-linked outer membrane protein [Pedobacter ginsengisoli]|uniref:SusC/RagA family TonB-linked outer membrane protein n=1 Tax=Pedobacter ginsengisoli TaxID=363852 RepID=UPI002550FA64|nr:SusC/RagA family TonB-linked outer membrane protein [Pedobacter ginsengisoli]
MQVSAAGFAQKFSLTTTKESLKNVFAEVQRQTGFSVLAKSEYLNNSKPVTISIKDIPLEEALTKILAGQNLSFSIEDKVVLITEKEVSLLDKLSTVISNMVRDLNVKGRVVDQDGKPLPNASIRVKSSDPDKSGGKNTVINTNQNGEFEIKDVAEDAVLLISYVGYKTLEIPVKGAVMPLEIKLNVLTGELEEVKVTYTTGYQSLPKERATGSFVQIDNDLFNRRVSADVLSRLEGITSGLLFDKTSGNDLGISIRGKSTIFSNTQPLIVLDNFPYRGDINTINPNDIESVTVLKDAAAASIWGAYSGNGVIVITTKKGRYNQGLKIGINSNLSIAEKPDLQYDKQFLNASDYIDVEKYLFDKNFYDADLADAGNPPLSPVVEILAKLRSGTLLQTQADAQINSYRNLDVRNDYSRYFYRKEVKQQYALNLSGGSEKTTYFLSAGYDKNLASIKRNQNDRLSINSLVTFRPLSNLEISGGITYTYTHTKNNGIPRVSASGKYNMLYPYAQLADAQGNPLPLINRYRETFAANPGVNGMLNWQYYPLNELDLTDNTTASNNNRITTGVKYTFLKGLSAELRYQLLKDQSLTRVSYSADSYYARDLINQYSVVQNGAVTKRNIPLGAVRTDRNGNLTANNGRIQLNYNNLFKDHEISTIVGAEVQESKQEGTRIALYGYDKAVGTSVPVDFANPLTVYPSGALRLIPGAPTEIPYTLDRFRSYFGNAAYTYNGRYTLSASARLDQSNLFGVNTNQKGVPLWSVGGKWNIDREAFYKTDWLPVLSLRATYGFNGNLNRNLAAVTTAIYSIASQFNNSAYAYINTPGNPELRWEKTGMFNIGLDFGLRNNIFSGSIEYFRKKGTDLIGYTTVASSTGFSNFQGNFSSMRGSGIDISLTGRIDIGGLNWESGLLFSHATDKITKNESNDLQQPGKPVNGIFSYRWGGLDASGDPLGYVDNALSKDYALILEKAATDISLYQYNGPGTPQYFGSFRNTFTWKGLSLSANILYKFSYFFRRSSLSYQDLFNSSVGHADFSGRWKNPGDEAFTAIPAMVYTDYPQFASRGVFYRGSSALVEKGSHIRLQDIRLGYAIGKSQWAKLPFESIRFYLYANNLGLLWKANDKNIDPDFIEGFVNPKSFSLGIQIGL